MTMPDERTRAVQNTYKFLLELLDPKKTPRVPREVRIRAARLIKHYPGNYYLEESAKKLPEIWG